MISTPNSYEYTSNNFKITGYLTLDQDPKVVFEGAMRLDDAEEAHVNQLLGQVIAQSPGEDQVVLDLRSLNFINSRGISVLYKFAINLRNQNVNVNIFAVKQSAWQQATLNNILKLSPDSIITWSEAGN